MMLQRYQPEIATAGELSLVFLGGEPSHACVKHPAPGDFRVQGELGGRRAPLTPEPALVAHAEAVLRACPGPQLYARVDLLESEGEWLLTEVELIDPALYLADAPGAAGRFADERFTVEIPQRKGDPIAFATDENVRAGMTVEGIAKMKPAFKRDGGSVTALPMTSASGASKTSFGHRRPAAAPSRHRWYSGPVRGARSAAERPVSRTPGRALRTVPTEWR